MPSSVNLEVPGWVQAAWSQPPKKGDTLFCSGDSDESREHDPEMNAVLRKGDDYAYSEGYRLTGRIMADYVIQNVLLADFLVYPVIFLYRHYIELQLKRLIPAGALLVKHELTEANRKLLHTSHELDALWALFEPILQKARQGNIPISPEDIEGLDWYVRQIHEFAPHSASRYAVTRSGQPSIDNERYPSLNIGAIAEGMERLAAYLFGLGEAIHEANELKCEMDGEHHAEGVGHHN